MAGSHWPFRLLALAFGGREEADESPSGPELWRALWKSIQGALVEKGFDPGPVDGIRGPRTDAAIAAFKRSRGLAERAYLGEITMAALFAGTAQAPRETRPEPHWMAGARARLGLKEIPGGRHAPAILAMWRIVGARWFTDDETPWCGAFVGAVLKEAGLAIPAAAEAPRARAWADWGRRLAAPAVGAVVVLWRGSPGGTAGHVGFVVGRDRRGRLMVLGGNQANAVAIDPFDPVRVLADGFRWPAEEPLPEAVGWSTLPEIVDGASRPSSRDER